MATITCHCDDPQLMPIIIVQYSNSELQPIMINIVNRGLVARLMNDNDLPKNVQNQLRDWLTRNLQFEIVAI